MDILTEQRKLNTNIYDIVKQLKFMKHRMNIAGSSSLKSQHYFSDYDFNSLISRNYKQSTIYNEFKHILSHVILNLYFIEFKIEYDDDSKIKLYDVSKLKKSMFKNIKFVKIDYVVWIEYHFKELSIMYIFKQTKYSVDDIMKDYNQLIHENNLYKALKRLFSIYKINKNRNEALKLTKFFNQSPLYNINSNLKAIQLMKQTYGDDSDVNKKIIINLKYLKLNPNIDIDEVIKENDEILNNSAKKYLI